jgi:hypothetical protein
MAIIARVALLLRVVFVARHWWRSLVTNDEFVLGKGQNSLNLAANCIRCISVDRITAMRSFMLFSIVIRWWHAFELL